MSCRASSSPSPCPPMQCSRGQGSSDPGTLPIARRPASPRFLTYPSGMEGRESTSHSKRTGPGDAPQIAVVIPCFKVARHVMDVLARVGPECSHIYVVDDACPERSGDIVEAQCSDPRVRVIRHSENRGVGAAVMTGYRAAIADGAAVIVKIDGDGQMAPERLPDFIAPIIAAQADYTKGNRFYDLANIGRMPPARAIGNAALSFMAKLSCGYWDVFDPTNGYTAIHANVARQLPLDRISAR